MIRYSEQYIDQKDISNVIKTLKSKFITTEPQIEKFGWKLGVYLANNQKKILLLNEKC